MKNRLSILKLDSRKYPRHNTSKQRKASVLSEQSTQDGLITSLVLDSYSIIKNRWRIFRDWEEDFIRQFFVETIKRNRNEDRILKLKQDIRDNVKLLSD